MSIQRVRIDDGLRLESYGASATLAQKVRDLEAEARTIVPKLEGRRVWMINSTEYGGGVAEMLPRQLGILQQLGVNVSWGVVCPPPDRAESFFRLTKRLHNLFHGAGDPELDDSAKELYFSVSSVLAGELDELVRPGDIVVIHDPQPMGAGHLLSERSDVRLVWRCHIGLDRRLPETRAAWRFVQPYADGYVRTVFSMPEYIPSYLVHRSQVITPAIDPLSHKNRTLSPHKLMGILCNAGLAVAQHPLITEPFKHRAARLTGDGDFVDAGTVEDVGFMFRPVFAQISRWDRLKGFEPLLDAFVRFKACRHEAKMSARAKWRCQFARLVLAGPDPTAVADDPEAVEVLRGIRERYRQLPEELKRDIAVISLPMKSRKQNALIVNAMQTTATVAVQNSLQEGFGLTATEAMWKRVPVIGSKACGLRHQIRDGCDGWLVDSPEEPDCVAEALRLAMRSAKEGEQLGRNAQRRVWDEYLIFDQLARWLRLLARVVA